MTRPKKIKLCLYCNKQITSDRHNIFCNRKCAANLRYKEYIDRWHCGLEDGLKGKYQISNYIRRYLKDKYNNKCSRCGWSEINKYTGEVPLEIEHIDGNYLNNNENNLYLICPNCHSLTSTYKGANRGNGRKDRKSMPN